MPERFSVRIEGRMNGKRTYEEYFKTIKDAIEKLDKRSDIVNGMYQKGTQIDYILSFDVGLKEIWELVERD